MKKRIQTFGTQKLTQSKENKVSFIYNFKHFRDIEDANIAQNDPGGPVKELNAKNMKLGYVIKIVLENKKNAKIKKLFKKFGIYMHIFLACDNKTGSCSMGS